MPQLTRKRVVLAKIETTYGTDPTPTGGSNAIQVSNLNVTPIAANMVGRDIIRSFLGESDQLVADRHVEIDFEVEMQGSGALGTAPAYGPLLRACGMSETITASTKVEYLPISSAFESVTMYMNVDGVNHKITGARGTVDLDITAKQIPKFKFKFVGIYNAVTDTSLPSGTYTAFKTPLVANNTNTTGFSFLGVTSLVLESLMLSVNNTVNFRALIGNEYAQMVDRRSSGEAKFEATSIATLDVFANALGNSTGVLSITHGTANGYKVKLDCPAIDLGNPAYEDSDGVNMIKVPFYVLPSSGNDEFKITII
jgi:hypothetical protein